MKINIITVPEHCAVIEDWFTDDELSQVYYELDHMVTPHLMYGNNARDGAAVVNGSHLKKGYGVFLDNVYPENRDLSPILKFSAKVFDGNFVAELCKSSSYFEQIKLSTRDNTVVNYYENNDEYREHVDISLYTACTYIWKEPKSFTGGDFYLRETKISLKNNMTVIFPGFVKHSAETVHMKVDDQNKRMGRWSIAKFINYRA